MNEQTIQALEARCAKLEEERDRFFHMKRVNAGLYFTTRERIQKARAFLDKSMASQARGVLGEMDPPPEWLSELLDQYVEAIQNSDIDDHLLTMCRKVEEFLTFGQEAKANRWFGFIQGVLWMSGIYTIDEMRAQMRGAAL
jgi:hypothetical protein